MGEDLVLENAIIGDDSNVKNGHSYVHSVFTLTLSESCPRGEILYKNECEKNKVLLHGRSTKNLI